MSMRLEREIVIENRETTDPVSPDPMLVQLGCALDAVGTLIANVQPGQWSAPTPCTEWDVRRLVEHLTGMNRVFTALLLAAPPPRRPDVGAVDSDPVGSYRDSAAELQRAFGRPGALDREYVGPLGSASGRQRLQIRLYDLLAHGWDLAQATGQPADLPDDLAEQSLVFARTQVSDNSRAGRFGPPTEVSPDAPAIERLVAFLGRPVSAAR
jgi:uncharacterized protein (TIGR03086 family)